MKFKKFDTTSQNQPFSQPNNLNSTTTRSFIYRSSEEKLILTPLNNEGVVIGELSNRLIGGEADSF
jgi:hypothetical protein